MLFPGHCLYCAERADNIFCIRCVSYLNFDDFIVEGNEYTLFPYGSPIAVLMEHIKAGRFMAVLKAIAAIFAYVYLYMELSCKSFFISSEWSYPLQRELKYYFSSFTGLKYEEREAMLLLVLYEKKSKKSVLTKIVWFLI